MLNKLTISVGVAGVQNIKLFTWHKNTTINHKNYVHLTKNILALNVHGKLIKHKQNFRTFESASRALKKLASSILQRIEIQNAVLLMCTLLNNTAMHLFNKHLCYVIVMWIRSPLRNVQNTMPLNLRDEVITWKCSVNKNALVTIIRTANNGIQEGQKGIANGFNTFISNVREKHYKPMCENYTSLTSIT